MEGVEECVERVLFLDTPNSRARTLPSSNRNQ